MNMSSCINPPTNAPVINLVLVGRGEPLLKMEKRLSCAAAGAGIRLKVDISKDAEAMGILLSQTPTVLHNGKMIFKGLPRTEEIEAWLKNLI